MPRRGGKRIRMDDPVPPEYQEPMTPMTPMTPMNDNIGGDGQDNYAGYSTYNQAPQTPSHTPRLYFLNNVLINIFHYPK